MKKKLLSAILCGTMVLSMTACGVKAPEAPAATETPAPAAEEKKEEPAKEEAAPVEETAAEETAAEETAAEPEVVLVYAEVNPLDSIVGQTATAFQEKVTELSGGKMYIDVQASGVLGSETNVLDDMLAGGTAVQMSRISAFALTSYGGQKSKLLSLPYTFVNRDHYWNFATSDLAEEFLIEPHENGTGVIGLFYGEEGFRHFFTTKDINGMEDLAGMKIRVSNDPVMVGLVEGIGASATQVDFKELYSALQSGVVDGAEQPIANYKSNAFPEVAPYLILDGHTLGAIQVVITDAAWNSLTAEQQDILKEAGKYASEFNRKLSADAEAEVLEQLKADGVKVVEVTDPTPWQEAVKDVVAENIKGQEDLYQKILDMK